MYSIYSWKQTFGWVWFRLRPEGWTKRIVDRVPYVRASSQIVNLTKLSREITHKEPTRNIDSTASKRTQQQLYNANVRVLYVYVYLSSWKTSKQLGFRSKWCDPCSIMYGFFFSCLNVFSTQIYWWNIPTIAELMLAQEKRRIWSTHLNRIPPHLIGSSAFDLMQITRNNLSRPNGEFLVQFSISRTQANV